MRVVERTGSTASQSIEQEEIAWPQGLLGQLKSFFLEAAPRPMEAIAEAGAVAYLAGIVARAYNVSGTGLNQYILALAPTSYGKDIISGGTSKLNSAICIANGNPQHPIKDCVGPSELVSQAGIYKWLARKPNTRIMVGEVGKLYSQITNPNNHLYGISRALLQLYSKSGHGEIFGAQAYSKKDDVIEAIEWPAVTFIGESVPDSFYLNVDEATVRDGLFPRHLLWEFAGQKAYANKAAGSAYPSQGLISQLSNLAAACAANENQKQVKHVALTPDAEARFDEFDRWTTDVINARQLGYLADFWGRAHLKALKLAALAAVGENWVEPVITLALTNWATNLVANQTNHIIARIRSGEVGEEAGNQVKQQNEVIRVIREYNSRSWLENKKYHGDEAFHKHAIITFAHIQQRLSGTAAFRKDRLGASAAIERTVKSLLSADIIREMPPKQMSEKYGKAPRAFCVSDPNIIVNGMNA